MERDRAFRRNSMNKRKSAVRRRYRNIYNRPDLDDEKFIAKASVDRKRCSCWLCQGGGRSYNRGGSEIKKLLEEEEDHDGDDLSVYGISDDICDSATDDEV